jgi:hypothetical protein
MKADDFPLGHAAFLVRLKADQPSPRDFVGIFVADGHAELIDLVDECCPVDCCEYAILPSGGIYQPAPSFPVPLPQNLDAGEADFFKDASICENWAGPMYSGSGLVWTVLTVGGAAND